MDDKTEELDGNREFVENVVQEVAEEQMDGIKGKNLMI